MDRFADVLDLLVINLKEAGLQEELRSESLYLKVQRKMNQEMVTEYKRWVKRNHQEESIEVLREWVLQEAEYKVVAAETIFGLQSRQAQQQTYYGQEVPASEDKDSASCVICDETHDLSNCPIFQVAEVDDRWTSAQKHQLCFRCLKQDHRAYKCKSKGICGEGGCRRTHHPLLHTKQRSWKPVSRAGEADEDHNEPADHSNTAFADGNSRRVALRTIPVTLIHAGRKIKVNALLDDGSTKTYLNTDVAAELKLLTGRNDEITVGTMGGDIRTFATEEVKFELQSNDGKTMKVITAFTTKRVTGSLQAVSWRHRASDWDHLKHLPFPEVATRKTIDLLIGLDQAELHSAIREVKGRAGEPIARLTPLGWTCVGRIKQTRQPTDPTFPVNFSFHGDDQLDRVNQLIQKFWEIEKPGPFSPEELITQGGQEAFETVKRTLH